MSKRRLLVYTGIILVFIAFHVVFALLAPPGSIIPGLAGIVVFAGGFVLFIEWTDYYSDEKNKKTSSAKNVNKETARAVRAVLVLRC